MQREGASKKDKLLRKLDCRQLEYTCDIKGRLFGRNLVKVLKIFCANNKDAKFVIKKA